MAVGSAVGAYFLLNERLGTEVTSWVCMACAMPCALIGFIRFQGQTFERFVKTWVESEMLFPSVLVCRCENAYYEAVQRRREGQLPEIKAQSDAPGKTKKQQPVQQQVRKQKAGNLEGFQVGIEPTATARIKDSRRGTAGCDTYQSPNIYKFRKRGKLR